MDNTNKRITKCKSFLKKSLERFSEDFLLDIEKKLEDNIDHAATNQAHIYAFEQLSIHKKHKSIISREFNKNILNGFELFKDNKLCTQIRENEFQTESWSLLDESILEEIICITTHTKEVKTEYRERLWQFEQRLEHIQKVNVNQSNNPLAPIQFFVALRNTLKPIIALNITAKILYYKALRNIINQQYSAILNRANTYLISEGILPDIRYEKQLDKSYTENQSSNRQDTVNPTTDQQVTSYDGGGGGDDGGGNSKPENASSEKSLVKSIKNLLQRARQINDDDVTIPVKQKQEGIPEIPANTPGAESTIPIPQEPVVFSEIQIIDAVKAVQDSAATAHFFSAKNTEDIITTPTNISENSAKVYRELYNASPDGSISAQNMYTIDMVGMLFEYILGDENLPDSVKTLLSHLHTPFLKLAFLDKTFFDNKQHESKMLLNLLAEAGASWVHHNGTSQYDMYNEIKRVVQRAVKEFKNDVTLFGELYMQFNILVKRVANMHKLRERNSIEKKQGQEKHEQAKALARKEIKKRIEGKRVPSSIIGLLSPWFVYLTHINLREGLDSEKWKQAIGVIDNLIMYSSIKSIKQDTKTLEESFETIIASVKSGLKSISYSQKKSEVIINELNALKGSILKREMIKTTVTKEQNNDSEDDMINNSPSPEEKRVMNYIKLIDPGTWIEYNKEYRLKVNGYNSETGKYILIDQSSQEVTMRTRLEFARDILMERATIIDGTAKPLFERALENIRKNLSKQVQVSSMIT